MNKGSIIPIQILRWVAATVVVIAHAQQELVKLAERSQTTLRFDNPIEFGIGVDIFFVISGFLMLHVSRGQFCARGAPLNFLKRRIVRIIPLYWLASLSMLLAILIVPNLVRHNQIEPLHVIMSFLMIAWPDSWGNVFPILNVGWTLNLEAYFYVIFAFCMLFREWIAVTLLVAYFVVTVAVGAIWPQPNWVIAFYFQSMVLEFAAGVLLALLYRSDHRIQWAGAVLIVILALFYHVGIRSLGHPPRVIGSGLPAIGLFYAFVFASWPAGTKSASRFFHLLGDASYAQYLTHPFTINITVELLTRLGVRHPVILIFSATFASLAVSVLIFKFVERPLLRYGQKWFFPLRHKQQSVDGPCQTIVST